MIDIFARVIDYSRMKLIKKGADIRQEEKEGECIVFYIKIPVRAEGPVPGLSYS